MPECQAHHTYIRFDDDGSCRRNFQDTPKMAQIFQFTPRPAPNRGVRPASSAAITKLADRRKSEAWLESYNASDRDFSGAWYHAEAIRESERGREH